jgi:short-subunit dehydrogenase
VIVITGASSGIGAATAVACARAGWRTVLTARRADRLRDVADAVRALSSEAVTVVGDVAEPAMSKRLLDAAEKAFGCFDAVFANAGYGLERPITATDDAALRRLFDVNLFAGVDLLREAASRLRSTGRGGHLLMCSSCLSTFTIPYYGAYSATKAAQHHICRSLRMELHGTGIHVSSVHPITTRTEFHQVVERERGEDVPPTATPDHAPELFIQPPDRVSRAIVRCLERPRPEVWTSWIVRANAALMNLSPTYHDFLMRKEVRRRRHVHEKHPARAAPPD